MGLPELSFDAHGGQSYFAAAAKARTGLGQPKVFPNRAWRRLQICAGSERKAINRGIRTKNNGTEMTHFRLRTQLLVATLLIICGLTGALLLIIRHTVSVETERQVHDGTEASVRAFESVQRQREQQFSRTAAMLADLPTLKAQMQTEHAPTIQDASTSWWKLSGSDLFLLALPDRRIVALHMSRPGWRPEAAEGDLKRSIDQGDDDSWWYDNGRLYEVFLRT